MSSSAPPAVEFWFEFGSNYSYLTVMRIEDLVRRAGLRLAWKPFLLGPIFRELGAAVSEANKLALREQTAEARRRGVFGAPTFFVGDEMFWGDDRLEDAIGFALAKR